MSILTAVPFSLQIMIVLLFGLALGSFANVCIYRLPKNESVILPRSLCPACSKKILPWDNIPVLSYFLLRGKCRQCDAQITIFYPIIEILIALLLLFGFINLEVSWKFAIFCILGPALVIIAIIDIKHKIIPDIITLPGILLGFLTGSFLVGSKNSLIGLLVGAGSFLIISETYYRIRGTVGIGGGDIKFIAGIGALLGWQQVILVIFLSAFMGSAVGIVGLVGKRLGPLSQIPFGPFLAVGTLISYFAGDYIIRLYIMMITGDY